MPESASPTIVMINEVGDLGGGQTVLLQQADALSSRGWTITLVAPVGEVADRFVSSGHRHIAFGFRRRRLMSEMHRVPLPKALAARVPESWRLRAIVRRLDPTVVQSSSLCAHLDVSLWPTADRGRCVWYLHQVHPAALFAVPLPRRIIGVSQASLAPAAWRRAAVRRSVVIRNGVDTERFRPDPVAGERVRRELGVSTSRPVVVAVSRLAADKGVEVLLEAAGILEDVTFVIVGSGAGDNGVSFERKLRARAAAGPGDVRLLGHREDVPAIMNAADLVVLPSPLESFGLVLAEAAACARPVVACDMAATREVVVHGVSGLLVRPDSDRVAWAGVIAELLADPKRLAEMGQEGREAASTFDLRHFAESIGLEFGRAS